jgi:uncharacterized membrane protein
LPADEPPAAPATGAHPVPSTSDGYLQAIDHDTLMALAESHDLRLHVAFRAGDFVRTGDLLLHATPSERVDDEIERTLRGAFFRGAQATDQQDPEFPINQMVEIAVRALSPGVNDPFTAIHCVDWLGAGLSRMAAREDPSPVRRDDAGTVRVVARTYSFRSAVNAAFDQIRQHGRGSLAVTLRLLEVLGDLGGRVRTEGQRESVRRQLELAYEGVQPAIEVAADREDLERRYRRAMAALSGEGAGRSPDV